MRFATTCITSALGITLASTAALAIPNQHLNPHSDAAPDISWPNPAPAAPETTNHFHLVLRGGETITQNANFVTSNKAWRADSVWDDRFYRFVDANNDVWNDNASRFGHGYIDPAFRPRYWFNNVPAAAQPLLTQSFASWNTAAQAAATAVGNKTPANNPTKTSIAFENVAQQASSDFQVLFAPNVLSTQNAYAEWIASNAQDKPGGPALAALTMVYEENPTNSVFFASASNWQLRLKDANPGTPGNQPGPWTKSHNVQVGWHFGAGAPAANSNVDFEYRDSTVPASVFDTLQAGSDPLLTDTFDQFAGNGAADSVNFFPMDFLTIALHETGHILGLLHDPTSNAGGAANIMRSQIAFNAGFGRAMRAIDADSAYGAAILYTIPIPEPAWLSAACVGLLMMRRRRGPRRGSRSGA